MVESKRPEERVFVAAARAGGAVSGLVLCGGASTRMGSDKSRAGIDGETLIERAVRIVSGVTSDVRLACGPVARYADLGLTLVCDRGGSFGPLSGLEAGLSSAPHGRVVVLACDMPHADAHVLAGLLERARDEDLDVACLRSARGLEPLCAVWSTALAPRIRVALEHGRHGVQAFLATIERVRAFEAPGDETCAHNVNTPADLERARRASPAEPRNSSRESDVIRPRSARGGA